MIRFSSIEREKEQLLVHREEMKVEKNELKAEKNEAQAARKVMEAEERTGLQAEETKSRCKMRIEDLGTL